MQTKSFYRYFSIACLTCILFACSDSSSASSEEKEVLVERMAGAYFINYPLKNASGAATGEYYNEMGWLDFSLYSSGKEFQTIIHIQPQGHAAEEIEGTYVEDSSSQQKSILFTKGDFHFQIDISSSETSAEGISVFSGFVSRVTATDRNDNAGGFSMIPWDEKDSITRFSGTLSPISMADSVSGQWVISSMGNQFVGSFHPKASLFNMFIPLSGIQTGDSIRGTFYDGTFTATIHEQILEGFTYDSEGETTNILKGSIQ